jgi:hypothetical protein
MLISYSDLVSLDYLVLRLLECSLSRLCRSGLEVPIRPV